MKSRVIFFLLFLSSFTQGQTFINGIIQDSLGNPIQSASIQQVEAKENSTLDSIRSGQNIYTPLFYFSQSDWLGAFHLVMDTLYKFDLKITAYGYVDTIIELESLPSEPILIKLKTDSSQLGYLQPNNYHYRRKNRPTEISMGLEFFSRKYDEFTPLLGNENVTHINKLPLAITFDFAKNYGRVYAGLTFGFSYNQNRLGDTLNIEVNNSLFSFQLGYKIIDSKKIILLPQISTKLYRTRLINGKIGGDNSLPNFLNDKDIDLRFLQPVIDFGISLGYKVIPKHAVKNNYFIFGIHGGYPIKMIKNPRVNGLRTKLKTDRAIDVGDFTIGIFWRSHFL